MDKYFKLLVGLVVVALVATVVANHVYSRRSAAKKARKGQHARGDIWQTPVAYAPMNDDAIGGMAG